MQFIYLLLLCTDIGHSPLIESMPHYYVDSLNEIYKNGLSTYINQLSLFHNLFYHIQDMQPRVQVVHKVEFTVFVNSVRIEIRFPCKLQVGIKLGKQEICLKEEVQLKSGNAVFSEPLRSETYLAYDSNLKRYVDKKATLTIYVVSARGKNVAGIFPIELAHILNRSDQEQSFFNQKLERCPDKDATINLRVKGNLVEEMLDANLSLVGDLSFSPGIPPFSGRSTNTVLSISSQIPRLDTRFLSSPKIEANSSTKKIQRSFADKSNKRSFVDEISTPNHNRVLVESYSSEIRKISSKDDHSTINETFKLKSKIDELESQTELLKKQVIEKKKLQNQNQSLSYKISELQKVISSNRIEIDSTNKEKKRDNNDLNNRIQELQKLNVTLQKRADAKNSFYKQQIEKYNLKLLASENEKQQLGLEITTLKDQTFDLNRKINVLKDKERLLNDEKVKLTKRVEELKKQLLQKQTTVDVGAKDAMYERLKQTISNNELQKLALMEELEKFKAQVLNQSIFRTKYEIELKEKNTVIQQKLQLENLLSEQRQKKDSDIQKLRKQVAEKSEQIDDLNKRLVELENKGKLEVSKMTDEIRRIEKELGSIRVSQDKGRQENLEVSNNLHETQRQLNEFNRKCISLDSALKQSQSENDQLRKSNKSYAEQSRTQIIQIKRLTETIQDLQNQYSLESQSKRNNQIQHKSIIDKLENTNKQLQTDLLFTQQELFSVQSQLTQNQNNFLDQLEKKDRVIQQKELELQKLFEQQTNLQMTNVQLQSKQAELRENVRVRESELNKERTLLQNLKKMNSTLEQSQLSLKSTLNETKSLLEEKETECEILIESNRSLQTLLAASRLEYQTFKQNISEHIHSLLKNLVTRGRQEEISIFQNLPQGLFKLEIDVVTKVKSCYDELQSTTQKLLNRQMQSINLEQNSNLQIQTLQIELAQTKKQFQLSKQEGFVLGENFQNVRLGLINQNEDLKRQMKELEVRLIEESSYKLSDSTNRYERDISKLREEHLLEKSAFENKIKELEAELAHTVKELEDQYNQVNIFNLKNYEYSQTIRELEHRLTDTHSKQELLESEKNKFLEDIFYLDQELQRVSKLYETVDRNLVLVLEREAILIEENQYLRNEFEGGSNKQGSRKEFEAREKNILEAHRINAENGKLVEMVRGLELRLGDKESVIKGLEERVKITQTNSVLLQGGGEDYSFRSIDDLGTGRSSKNIRN